MNTNKLLLLQEGLAHLEQAALTRAHNPRFPFDVAELMSAQGLMGITIPEADGGQGGTLLDAVIAIEQVAAACPRSADVVQFGNFGPIRTFAEYGSDKQKKRWLPDLLAGRMVMSLGIANNYNQMKRERGLAQGAALEATRASGSMTAEG
jgi:alkylation response protein AidB-like acyl-CoA dehydrogenase